MPYETRRKISEAKKGMPQPWRHHRRSGEKPSDATRRKISEALRGKPKPPRSQETRRKLSAVNKGKTLSEEHRRKIGEGMRGTHRSGETKARISGERNPNWRGGLSFGPYCPKFNAAFKERVRAFWGYACGLCGKSQEENGKSLSVHHVNYQKEACCDEEAARQFIPLCDTCHGLTGHDRAKWEKKLTRLIEKKYGGRCYFHQGEQLTSWGVRA